jgi:hypothetical protein
MASIFGKVAAAASNVKIATAKVISNQKTNTKNAAATAATAINKLTQGIVYPSQKDKIVANTSSKSVNTVLETAANNPAKTALVVAGASNIKATVAAAKTVASTPIAKTFANVKTTVSAAAIGTVAAGVLSNKTARKDVASAVSKTPGQLYNVGAGFGNAYEQIKTGDFSGAASTAGTTIKDNPIGSAVIGVGVAGVSAGAIYYGSKLFSGIGNNDKDLAAASQKEYENYMKNLQNTTDNLITTTNDDIPTTKTKDETEIVQSNTPLENGQLVDVSRNVNSARKYSKRKHTPIVPNLRITINNQNKNTKFIKSIKYM